MKDEHSIFCLVYLLALKVLCTKITVMMMIKDPPTMCSSEKQNKNLCGVIMTIIQSHNRIKET